MPAAVKLRALAPMPAALPARDVDLLATAVLLLDAGERIVHVNPAAENLFELSRQKFVGHTLADVFEPASAVAGANDGARAGGAA
jgi:nitrogen-specific signal transduction histidine kinase